MMHGGGSYRIRLEQGRWSQAQRQGVHFADDALLHFRRLILTIFYRAH